MTCQAFDVPSPIDLRDPDDALAWAQTALARRPVRPRFFDAFARAIRERADVDGARVLELGAGPGFLAAHLLDALPGITYLALDFSPAMHELARGHLGARAARVRFLERDFLAPDWTRDLPPVDVVVTHQAVHELRHKSRAATLHCQVRALLAPDGHYLVADHVLEAGGMTNSSLYMTLEEQRDALREAGFEQVTTWLHVGGLALHRAG